MNKLNDNLTLTHFTILFFFFYLETHISRLLIPYQSFTLSRKKTQFTRYQILMSHVVCCQDSKAQRSSFNFHERHFLEKSRWTKMLLSVFIVSVENQVLKKQFSKLKSFAQRKDYSKSKDSRQEKQSFQNSLFKTLKVQGLWIINL